MLRSTSSRLTVFGFVGLGQMGARMAVNVLKDASVTKLVLYDTTAAAVDEVLKAATAAHGAERAKCVERASSLAALGAQADSVLTMLPNGAIVESVYAELLSDLKKGALLIDGSTIDPATSKAVGARAVAKGAKAFCDAPVSGGVAGAAAGTLTFMVGADGDANFAAAQKMLAPMAKNIVHCGAMGAGQVVKLCNNLVLAQHMVAVSEAMLIGTKLGVDAKKIAAVMNTSTGKCWSSEICNPFPGVVETAPAGRGYTGGFAAALMHKDLGLAISAAKTAGVNVAGADNAMAMYSDMLKLGDGGKDFSAIIQYIEEGEGAKRN